MNDTLIPVTLPRTTVWRAADVNAPPQQAAVRVYKYSPEEIALQIRTIGPVAPSHRGAPMVSYSHATLSVAQARELINALEARITQITGGVL